MTLNATFCGQSFLYDFQKDWGNYIKTLFKNIINTYINILLFRIDCSLQTRIYLPNASVVMINLKFKLSHLILSKEGTTLF